MKEKDIKIYKSDPLIDEELNDKNKESEIIPTKSTEVKNTLKDISMSLKYLSVVNNRLYLSEIEVNTKQRKITLKSSKNNFVYLKINFDDFICFSSESDIQEPTKKRLKEDFELSTESLENHQFCRLTYISNNYIEYNKCCLCCCCKQTGDIKAAKLYISFFLIQDQLIYKLENELNKLNYCLYPSINEVALNNRKRRILFFVNPTSGTGKSLKIWNKAKSIFDLTNIDKKVIYTERPKHAYEVVLNLKIGDYDGIVNCSGDGILHEILNGIFHREDKATFIDSIVIGTLPAGSANGFSKAIADYSGDANSLENMCFYIAKGRSKRVDIQEMELRDVDKKVYSFLSLYYGFIADADLESEGLRCLGMSRTTLWGAYLWAVLRDNYGCLYYLPSESNLSLNDIPPLNQELDENAFVKVNDNWNLFIAANTKFIGEDILTNPKANLCDGYHDLLYLKAADSGRLKLLQYLLCFMDDGHKMFDNNGNISNGIHYCKTRCWRFIPKTRLTDKDDITIKHGFDRYYSIDGERYPICPIQVKTLNEAIRVYSGKE